MRGGFADMARTQLLLAHLMCEALESTREDLAFTAFERLFRDRGLPRAIRSDNGVHFASPNGPNKSNCAPAIPASSRK
jgi:hypothetical protein